MSAFLGFLAGVFVGLFYMGLMTGAKLADLEKELASRTWRDRMQSAVHDALVSTIDDDTQTLEGK